MDFEQIKNEWISINEDIDIINQYKDEPNKISININSNTLKVYLNGKEKLSDKRISCDNKKFIGFFNEVREVYISNLLIITI